MTDQSLFCPHCGAQQIKANARFCHVCGQALPARPAPLATPTATSVTARRRNWLWLLPLILAVAVIAAIALAWQRGWLDLGGREQAAWTPAAISARTVGGAATPAKTDGAGAVTKPAEEFPEVTVAPPANTPPPPATAAPQDTATPRPTATPPPTATPRPTVTPVPTPAPVVARANGTVNVRAGPGTAYPILGQVPAGTTFVIQGQNGAGTWWQVCCLNERPGWVSAELLSAAGLVNAPVIADIPPPPDPGRVVFVSDRNGFAHLFTVDGNGLRAITSGSEYFWDPILSDDGSRLAFVSKVGGNTEVFVADRDGSNRRPISNHPAEDDHPAWFPDNVSLAFASRRDGAWEIYRMNADGSNVRRLTTDGGDNRFVAVSPDGAQIAYVAQGSPYPTIQLMLMNADGGNRRVLYSYASRKQRDDPGRFLYRLDWSPDGTRIAFGADDDNDGVISILLIDAATGQAQRLIQDGNSPAWSPDGTRLIYKPAGERQILFVADAAGNRLYQLTGSDYNAWSPDWAR